LIPRGCRDVSIAFTLHSEPHPEPHLSYCWIADALQRDLSRSNTAAYITSLYSAYFGLPKNTSSFSMDVFGGFCLACDGQTNGTDYCSQTCRLAGLDHYGTYEPTSPIYCDTHTIARRPVGSVSSGLYLPPAIDFSVYRVSSSNSVLTLRNKPSTQARLSEKARNDLRDYVGAFDQTRTLRRRVSMQSTDSDKSSQ
jgi:hypothetical protein